MLGMKKLCGDNDYFVSKEEQSEIYLLLRRLIGECEEYLTDRAKNGIENEDLLQLYFDALMYVRIAEFMMTGMLPLWKNPITMLE